MELKQNTARSVMILMVDGTDLNTGKTGLTLTLTLSKNGGDFTSISPTVTEKSVGWYKVDLTTAHTDTLGDLIIHATATGAAATDVKYSVVANFTADVKGDTAYIGTPVALDGGPATLGGMLAKIADDNGGATFDATYDSLNKLKSAIVSGVPINRTAGGAVVTYGTVIGGTTYANTYLDDGVYYSVSPVAVNGLDFYLEFTLLATEAPSTCTVNGKFNAGAIRFANVYAWNWQTSAWDLLSDSATRFTNSGTDADRSYTLLSQHKDTATQKVRIRFFSASTTTGDQMDVDQIIIKSVVGSATVSEIAEAVWTHDVTNHNNHVQAGFFVSRIVIDDGDYFSLVGNVLTLTGLTPANNLYNGATLQIYNEVTGECEIRKILVHYITGGNSELTLDDTPRITVDANCHFFIMGLALDEKYNLAKATDLQNVYDDMAKATDVAAIGINVDDIEYAVGVLDGKIGAPASNLYAEVAKDATVAKEASLAALAQDATVAKEATVAAGFTDGAKEATVVAGFTDGAKEATVAAGFIAGAKDIDTAKSAALTAVEDKIDTVDANVDTILARVTGSVALDSTVAKEATISAGFAAAATAAALTAAQADITTLLSRITTAVATATDLATAQTDIDKILDLELGKMVLNPTAKTLTRYKRDGITVIQIDDLITSTNNMDAVVERVPR